MQGKEAFALLRWDWGMMSNSQGWIWVGVPRVGAAWLRSNARDMGECHGHELFLEPPPRKIESSEYLLNPLPNNEHKRVIE